MKIMTLIISLFLANAAHADISWNIIRNKWSADEKKEELSKLNGFSIEGNILYISFVDSNSYMKYYIITDQELKHSGLSKKDMMDLIAQYSASKDMTLYFNADIIPDTANALSLNQLFIYPKDN